METLTRESGNTAHVHHYKRSRVVAELLLDLSSCQTSNKVDQQSCATKLPVGIGFASYGALGHISPATSKALSTLAIIVAEFVSPMWTGLNCLIFWSLHSHIHTLTLDSVKNVVFYPWRIYWHVALVLFIVWISYIFACNPKIIFVSLLASNSGDVTGYGTWLLTCRN